MLRASCSGGGICDDDLRWTLNKLDHTMVLRWASEARLGQTDCGRAMKFVWDDTSDDEWCGVQLLIHHSAPDSMCSPFQHGTCTAAAAAAAAAADRNDDAEGDDVMEGLLSLNFHSLMKRPWFVSCYVSRCTFYVLCVTVTSRASFSDVIFSIITSTRLPVARFKTLFRGNI